ncbi:MAG TPA: sigma 54-interacting transcriptional regulator [Vicinamibacteria bacterium]|nr:sigma 54-interacting transcriptional regulator [Vicinamibacteria bacterium]
MPIQATTFGELKRSGQARSVPVREELRRNLVAKMRGRERLFPGVLGYDDTVVPQVVNAILSRHHMILLGLRGQAKSRLIRSLTTLLDPQVPTVAGCEIHDDPFAPLCRRCREILAERGDETEVVWLTPDERYVEKLATPDVTIADIIGDVDPIRAARGGHHLSSELTMHYGLLPRAHRGIFALNELPDLAGRIQVGLFNILQEGDVQIKGYPIRLPIDVAMVFTANPEDYTARGKIITPLKDRLGSEIRTHYPATLEQGVAITQQEAWTARGGELRIPRYIREVVEGVAFAARREKKIDKRSGVSQRLPISALENTVSNAERRALLRGERLVVPRVSDVYAAVPALTGKFELEYEGELMGGEAVARDLIKAAVAEAFSTLLGAADLKAVVAFFETGGSVKLESDASAADVVTQLRRVPHLLEHLQALGARAGDPEPVMASAAEFLLEGLYARKQIGRSDDRGFIAPERVPESDVDIERLERLRRLKKQVN